MKEFHNAHEIVNDTWSLKMEIEIMKGYIKCNAGDEVQRVKDQLSLMSYILNQRIHLACYLLMKSVEGYEPDFKIDVEYAEEIFKEKGLPFRFPPEHSGVKEYDSFFDSNGNFIWDNPDMQEEARALYKKYAEIEREQKKKKLERLAKKFEK